MKLGIIGTGKIVEDALFAIEPVSQIELKAIFAREHSRQKAEDFAARYKIAEVYTDYDELLEKADIDTVYIGLINSVHYENAKKALLKDKNVILAKPSAPPTHSDGMNHAIKSPLIIRNRAQSKTPRFTIICMIR